MISNFYVFSIIILSFALTACGGGSGGGTPPPATATATATATGVFVDSVVAGIQYTTPTKSGLTNSAGEYDYLPGETVTFSIGDIVLGSAPAGPVVTPLTLVSGAIDETDLEVTNIVRLLMTLDEDDDPKNGITITPDTTLAAAGLTVDFTAPDLTTDPGMLALLPLILGTPPLVDATTAQTHFTETLTSTWGSMPWGTGGKLLAATP